MTLILHLLTPLEPEIFKEQAKAVHTPILTEFQYILFMLCTFKKCSISEDWIQTIQGKDQVSLG